MRSGGSRQDRALVAACEAVVVNDVEEDCDKCVEPDQLSAIRVHLWCWQGLAHRRRLHCEVNFCDPSIKKERERAKLLQLAATPNQMEPLNLSNAQPKGRRGLR